MPLRTIKPIVNNMYLLTHYIQPIQEKQKILLAFIYVNMYYRYRHIRVSFSAKIYNLTSKNRLYYLFNYDRIISGTVEDIIPQRVQVITYCKDSVNTNRIGQGAGQPQREDLEHLLGFKPPNSRCSYKHLKEKKSRYFTNTFW